MANITNDNFKNIKKKKNGCYEIKQPDFVSRAFGGSTLSAKEEEATAMSSPKLAAMATLRLFGREDLLRITAFSFDTFRHVSIWAFVVWPKDIGRLFFVYLFIIYFIYFRSILK